MPEHQSISALERNVTLRAARPSRRRGFSTSGIVRSCTALNADRRIRSCGRRSETTWTRKDLARPYDFLLTRRKLNRFLPRYPQVILCPYEPATTSAGAILVRHPLKTHPNVLMGGTVPGITATTSSPTISSQPRMIPRPRAEGWSRGDVHRFRRSPFLRSPSVPCLVRR